MITNALLNQQIEEKRHHYPNLHPTEQVLSWTQGRDYYVIEGGLSCQFVAFEARLINWTINGREFFLNSA